MTPTFPPLSSKGEGSGLTEALISIYVLAGRAACLIERLQIRVDVLLMCHLRLWDLYQNWRSVYDFVPALIAEMIFKGVPT